jgi:UrcA family protein
MKSTFASRFALIGMTTIALGVGASHASAATPDQDARQVVVRYQDLDLSDTADAQRLYRRIQTAARAACENDQPKSPWGLSQYYSCVDRAVTRAVADVGSTQVSGIHEAANQHAANRG